MKKYYCATCNKFKNRLQLKREDNCMVSWLTCRWCHTSNIHTTEEILEKVAKIVFQEEIK